MSNTIKRWKSPTIKVTSTNNDSMPAITNI
jgi:hypothetical protein